MNTMYALAWLLIALFMFHEFEEIIFVEPWLKRNKPYIEKARAESKRAPFDFFRSTGSVALAIYEEFIIIALATFLSYVFNNFIVWYGLLAAFTIHLVIHILFSVTRRRYVPGVVSSVIVIIPSAYVLFVAAGITGFSSPTILISTVCALAFMLLNLEFLHKTVKYSDRWLHKLSEEKG